MPLDGDELQACTLKRLEWTDEDLGSIPLPARSLMLRASFGSGLTTRPGDAPGLVWAIGDRGPNIKIETLVNLYGVEPMKRLAHIAGAKVMPRPDLGPAMACLRVHENRVELVSSFRLRDAHGKPVSGLPIPGGKHSIQEPALDLHGESLPPDPGGFDTEGIAAMPDGTFWIGDEFGPSLVQVDAGGTVLARVVPRGTDLIGPSFDVRTVLPPIAARRQINRGFEAVAASDDGKWLFVAFQSPLAHPDADAHRKGRHVRLWRLDAATLRVVDEYLYPLDSPGSFARDRALGAVALSDVKVGELAWIGHDSLLVLERVTHSSRIYRVGLDTGKRLPERYLDIDSRPTLETLSASGDLREPVLGKTLLLDSDVAKAIPPDLEGMAVLSPTELLLVNDNDFGVEGVETEFWKATFEKPVLA